MVAELKGPKEVKLPIEAEELPAQESGARPLVSVAGLVRGVDVEIKTALIGAAVAADDISVERAFVRSVFAGGGLQMRQAGAGLIVSGGDTAIERAGAQAIMSAGTISMESAGSGFAIGRRIRVGQGGVVGLALTPRIEVAEGGRVIFGRSAAFAIVGGVLGLAALLAYLLRGRTRIVRSVPPVVTPARIVSLVRGLRRTA